MCVCVCATLAYRCTDQTETLSKYWIYFPVSLVSYSVFSFARSRNIGRQATSLQFVGIKGKNGHPECIKVSNSFWCCRNEKYVYAHTKILYNSIGWIRVHDFSFDFRLFNFFFSSFEPIQSNSNTHTQTPIREKRNKQTHFVCQIVHSVRCSVWHIIYNSTFHSYLLSFQFRHISYATSSVDYHSTDGCIHLQVKYLKCAGLWNSVREHDEYFWLKKFAYKLYAYFWIASLYLMFLSDFWLFPSINDIPVSGILIRKQILQIYNTILLDNLIINWIIR